MLSDKIPRPPPAGLKNRARRARQKAASTSERDFSAQMQQARARGHHSHYAVANNMPPARAGPDFSISKEKKKELPPPPMAARNSRFAAARRQDSNNPAAAGLFARLLMAKSLSGRTAQHGESWDRIP